jgi:hypothetical protein
MSTMKHFLTGALLLAATLLFTNCSKDDDGTNVTGTAQFEITDGPVDDASVNGAFVTVTAVKVDGETISNFSGKQTIDLMAYQNGNTKALGLAELETGTYNEVTLVLDYDEDANGNSPGCYVLTTDNVKHSLKSSANTSNEVKINTGSFEVKEGSTTNVVVDFDLRKSIRYQETPQADDQYDFVTDSELRASLRMVAKSNSGRVTGNCDDNLGVAGEKIVVYAYEKGEFDKDQEIQGQGESNIQFKNAVTSATVDAQGNYTLAFLEEGDYELHFFGYEDKNNDGKMEIKGELDLNIAGNLGIDLNDVSVNSESTVSISVIVLGLLP